MKTGVSIFFSRGLSPYPCVHTQLRLHECQSSRGAGSVRVPGEMGQAGAAHASINSHHQAQLNQISGGGAAQGVRKLAGKRLLVDPPPPPTWGPQAGTGPDRGPNRGMGSPSGSAMHSGALRGPKLRPKVPGCGSSASGSAFAECPRTFCPDPNPPWVDLGVPDQGSI